jgi:DNA-binding transcriptional MocR family regulator
MVQCDVALLWNHGIAIGTAMESAASKRLGSGWAPTTLGAAKGARYLAVVDALEADITAGRMQPGGRLLPQRDMATSLGLSVGTIAKAFAEATRRGLISAEVGRGTFVIDRSHTTQDAWAGPIDLTLNVSPPVGEAELVSQALAAIAIARRFE